MGNRYFLPSSYQCGRSNRIGRRATRSAFAED
jgi:hypothetical protein